MKLGKAFSDSLVIEQKTKNRLGREPTESWWFGAGRALMFFTILFVCFFILVWRLFDLTVVQGHHFRSLADGNRTRELIRHAPRGILRDRTGKPLVENVPYYRLLKPCTTNSNEDCSTPVSREEGDAMMHEGLPPGTFLEVDYKRNYLYPDLASHLIGYTGEITQKELQDDYYKLRYYRSGDRLGREGSEAVFEEKLRGRDGRELVEVNAQGKILRTLGRDKEIPGEDVILSLDIALQESVAANFPKNAKGAVVVSKPTTGEVLALYSYPSFDVNTFSDGLSAEEYEAVMNNPDRPMFNRAIGGTYPPGSTFKLVTALAALEEGDIKRDTTVEDVGVLKVGTFSFANWYFTQYGKTEGFVDIVKAIARSNDIFFYKVGEWLGIRTLVTWAHQVGIGKPLGIELAGEAGGLMPDPEWKKERFSTKADREAKNDQWYLGDTYHLGIGQGYLLVTPLQVNTWTNLIANGGRFCRPTIKKAQKIKTRDPSCKDLGVKKESTAIITEGMIKACESGGTGYPLFDFSVRKPDPAAPPESTTSGTFVSVPVACKTGTAEVGDDEQHTHAWFTVFAPVPKKGPDSGNLKDSRNQEITGEPEISVTVLVEEGGEGSSVAAPIAKAILEEWFGR